MLEAYAQLHAEGYLHGDVHPRNILVEAGGRVRLIDFGLAARIESPDRVPRGGIDLFLEPELARARLAGLPAPPASPAGEQYSVAALLYLVLTGAHTHVFSLDEKRMHRQLLADPPLPFATHDARGLEIVEPVLARALSKSPGDRFESMEAFWEHSVPRHLQAEAAGGDRKHSLPRSTAPGRRGPRTGSPVPLAEGELEPPTASINLGAAGLAYGALRIAAARDDASLLALAERWAARASLAAASPAGFENLELDITPEEIRALFALPQRGRRALRGRPRCAGARRRAPTEGGDRGSSPHRFARPRRSSTSPSARRESSSGARSLWRQSRTRSNSLPMGDELAERLAGSLRLHATASRTPLAETPLGTAHGWAGYLYALLRWSEARGLGPPPEAAERLDQLASFGVPLGRGLRWPREVGLPAAENALGASWCNGASGLVHLWLTAERLLGDARFGRLAEAAAWTAYDAPDAGGDLCCGAAGRAYALLAVHRQLGGAAWLDRSIALGERAARAVRRDPLRRDSLYKGEVGVAVLAADLERPGWAAMPLFEREGWPRAS